MFLPSSDRVCMKILILLLAFITFAYSQPRPTGTRLTDTEKIKSFQEIALIEKEILSDLNGHMKECQKSIKPSENMMDWIMTYKLLTTNEAVSPICTPEEVSCLKNFKTEIKNKVHAFLRIPNLKDYLVHRNKKMNSSDAELIILQLKSIFNLEKKEKSGAEKSNALFEKS